MAGLDSVIDVERFGLERFHCWCAVCMYSIHVCTSVLDHFVLFSLSQFHKTVSLEYGLNQVWTGPLISEWNQTTSNI